MLAGAIYIVERKVISALDGTAASFKGEGIEMLYKKKKSAGLMVGPNHLQAAGGKTGSKGRVKGYGREGKRIALENCNHVAFLMRGYFVEWELKARGGLAVSSIRR